MGRLSRALSTFPARISMSGVPATTPCSTRTVSAELAAMPDVVTEATLSKGERKSQTTAPSDPEGNEELDQAADLASRPVLGDLPSSLG